MVAIALRHNQHLDAVKVLLSYLADPLLTYGKSALEIAETNNEIAEALTQAIETNQEVT